MVVPVDSYNWMVISQIDNPRVIDCNVRVPRYPFQDARRSDATGHLRAPMSRRGTDGRGSDGSGQGLTAGRFKASWPPERGRAGARSPQGPPDALQRAAQRARPADRLDKPDDRLLAKPIRSPRRSS